jgi:glycosyltransferase involved in cell wall biosynthesis
MNNKIYYWSPFIDKVATIKSVINSSYSLAKYDKFYQPVLLNACGEWNSHKEEIYQKGIEIIDLTNSKILEGNRKKRGFFTSRLLYFLIISKVFFPLIKFLKKNQDEYIIIHLITSLPLFLNIFLGKKNKMILRISGLPKFTIFRKLLWSVALKKINTIFCPTIDTKNNLEKIFPNNIGKFKVLRDPVLCVNDIQKLKYQNFDKNEVEYFVSIGRLTKQKNYLFLLNFLKNYFAKKNCPYHFLIIGEGEEEEKLKDFIKSNQLENIVKMTGFKKNIFPYLKNAKGLISTSLWEDPGFTLIEAAYMNTTVISSDCPNGPKEILDNGANGYIFESNSYNSLENKFNIFLKDSNKIKNLKKIKIKKFTKNFTIFNHYKILQKTLNEIK